MLICKISDMNLSTYSSNIAKITYVICLVTLIVSTTFSQTKISQTEIEKCSIRLNEFSTSKKGTYSLAPAQEIQVRGGLPNFFAKLNRGQKNVTIAYFGTSVTVQPGWRVMSFEWFQKQFPKTNMTMINASLGGTGSLVGAFRADKDLIPCKADLVFIEFAGNDNGDATNNPLDVVRAMEGIVRKVWKNNPEADICFVYAFGSGDFKTLLAGNTPRGGTIHEFVAERYNLPSIQMSIAVAKLEQEGKLVNFAPNTPNGMTPDGKIIFTEDGSHPTIPLGHAIWTEAVIRGLQHLQGVGVPKAHILPKPLLTDNWELAKTISVDGNASFKGQWDKFTSANCPYSKSIFESFPVLYRTSTAGSSFTIHFKGTTIGIKGVTGPDAGFINIQTDNNSPQKVCQFTVYSTSQSYGGRPLPGMENGVHSITWTLLDEKPDKQKILEAYKTPNHDKDLINNPEKYAPLMLSVGQILLVGEILP